MRAIDGPGVATPQPRAGAGSEREIKALRMTCWRQTNEIHSLYDTIAVLRAGANRLAADNAILHAELTGTEATAPRAELYVLPRPGR
jgi:hypothetical protein